VARDAQVIIQTAEKRHRMPVDEFITGPGTTALSDTELLTGIDLPTGSVAEPGFWFYRKVAPRRSNALSKLSVYAEAQRSGDGALADLRLAIGAVAPTVVRLREAEQIMNGLTASALRREATKVLDLYRQAIVPIDDQRSTATYRSHTALALIRHIIEEKLPSYLEQT
jgi:CO/xanthine dehydrogenase FAD-binding subunit